MVRLRALPLEWLVPVVLFVNVIRFTARYGVDVLFYDSWGSVEYVAGAMPFTLGYFFEAHNEHRLLWEKALLYAGWARLTRWDEHGAQFLVDVLFGLEVLICLAGVTRRQPHLPVVARAALLASFSGVLLTLRQWESLVWSNGFSTAVVVLTTVLFAEGFVAAGASHRRFGMLAALVVASPLSLVQGISLAAFVVGFGLLSVARRQPQPRNFWRLWVLSAVTLSVFAGAYHRPPHHPEISAAFSHPLAAIDYCVLWIGSPFSAVPATARRVGAALLAAFAAVSARELARSPIAWMGQTAQRYPILPISLVIMLLMMVGRVGFGSEQALASRYVASSALCAVTIGVYVFDRIARDARAQAIVATLFLLGSALAYVHTDRNATATAFSRRRELVAYRDCALAHADDLAACDGTAVYPGGRNVPERTALLRDHQLSFFRP